MHIDEFQRLNKAMSNSWFKCQSTLDLDGFGRNIDEMSILLTNQDMNAYKEIAETVELDPSRRTPYMKWFNGTRDTMTMTDGAGGEPIASFDVRFEFYRGVLDEPEHRELPWRVEAMAVLGGFAPLHSEPMGRVVHASYKLSDAGEYDMELARLRKLGMTPVAYYANSYGQFSYWTDAGLPYSAGEAPILLKPRVNLRDA